MRKVYCAWCQGLGHEKIEARYVRSTEKRHLYKCPKCGRWTAVDRRDDDRIPQVHVLHKNQRTLDTFMGVHA